MFIIVGLIEDAKAGGRGKEKGREWIISDFESVQKDDITKHTVNLNNRGLGKE
jgi:hypothetical protein